MKAVMSSATEDETGALFYSGKEAAPLRIALAEMGHPQKATPIQTDNACAPGITNNTVKQKRSKAMDTRFYWIKDRVEQGQYQVHWQKGADKPSRLLHKTPLAFTPSANALEILIGTPQTAKEQQTGHFWQGCVDVSLRVTPRRRHIQVHKERVC